MAKRKTSRERDAEWQTAAGRVWQKFRTDLRAAISPSDVERLLADSPAHDQPGRGYYQSLRFFRDSGFRIVPDGADIDELRLYADFIKRHADAGHIQDIEAEQILAALRAKGGDASMG